MDTCRSCGARLAPDVGWCGQCYTPVAAPAPPASFVLTRRPGMALPPREPVAARPAWVPFLRGNLRLSRFWSEDHEEAGVGVLNVPEEILELRRTLGDFIDREVRPVEDAHVQEIQETGTFAAAKEERLK